MPLVNKLILVCIDRNREVTSGRAWYWNINCCIEPNGKLGKVKAHKAYSKTITEHHSVFPGPLDCARAKTLSGASGEYSST